MNRLFKFVFKASLLSCALCAALVPGAAAAPQWDYVYFSTATTPDAYPGGEWGLEAYGDAQPSIVNGRLYFNVRDGLFFYGRDEQMDPRIYASTFTYEWRQEVISTGTVFSMAMYYADGQGIWVELIYNGGLTLIADGESMELPEALATGAHTYRLVKRDSQVELYVDGTSVATMPVGAYTVNYLELSGWGMEDSPYEAYWDHVAYTRGAYTPAELPSPGASTTTCVEVTGVPNWKQYDDGTNTWWKKDYDHTTKKISALGCLLTATAQVVKKYGFDTDPGKLNEMLKKTPSGFKEKNLNSEVLVSTIAAQGLALSYKPVYGTNAKLVASLGDSLASGNPVILELYSVTRVGKSHFVVATKKCKDAVYINDPGHNSSVTTLDQYFNLITNGNPKIIRSIRKIVKKASL
ncbi:MAG: C39 family peptidase [Elusimicrobiales bacterium]|nr:C39 family peptidase [Elusimicrobiales bacterium]